MLTLLIKLPDLENLRGKLLTLYLFRLLSFFDLSIYFLVCSLQSSNFDHKSLFFHMQFFDLLLSLFEVLFQLHNLMLANTIFRLQIKHFLRLCIGLPHQQFCTVESADYRMMPIRNHRQLLFLLLPIRKLFVLSSHNQFVLIACRPHLYPWCWKIALTATMQIHLTSLPLARLGQTHPYVYLRIPVVAFLHSVGKHLSIFVEMHDVAKTYLNLPHLDESALCPEL